MKKIIPRLPTFLRGTESAVATVTDTILFRLIPYTIIRDLKEPSFMHILFYSLGSMYVYRSEFYIRSILWFPWCIYSTFMYYK